MKKGERTTMLGVPSRTGMRNTAMAACCDIPPAFGSMAMKTRRWSRSQTLTSRLVSRRRFTASRGNASSLAGRSWTLSNSLSYAPAKGAMRRSTRGRGRIRRTGIVKCKWPRLKGDTGP